MPDILFRACIHAEKIPENEIGDTPLESSALKTLDQHGLKTLRIFGFPSADIKNKFLLLRFEIVNHMKIGDIDVLLEKYIPTYCFSEICPRTDIQCPAHRP